MSNQDKRYAEVIPLDQTTAWMPRYEIRLAPGWRSVNDLPGIGHSTYGDTLKAAYAERIVTCRCQRCVDAMAERP